MFHLKTSCCISHIASGPAASYIWGLVINSGDSILNPFTSTHNNKPPIPFPLGPREVYLLFPNEFQS